jgi:hypothetical protein
MTAVDTLIANLKQYRGSADSGPVVADVDLLVAALQAIPQSITVALTANQLNHLLSAPPEILPSPGPRKFNVVMSVAISYTFGGVAFVFPGSVDLQYTDRFGPGLGMDIKTGISGQGSSQIIYDTPDANNGNVITDTINVENSPIVMAASGGDAAPPGNGSAKVTLTYLTLDV